jgi:hypothetical protein
MPNILVMVRSTTTSNTLTTLLMDLIRPGKAITPKEDILRRIYHHHKMTIVLLRDHLPQSQQEKLLHNKANEAEKPLKGLPTHQTLVTLTT